MRTTKAAATDVASGSDGRPVYYDALFRDIKGSIVRPPAFPTGARFADTHAHLDMLHHPELALARCAMYRVDYVITVIDPTEDPQYTLENLDGWLAKAKTLAASFLAAAVSAGAVTTEAVSAETNPEARSPELPAVRIIAGCHPHNAAKYDKTVENALVAALKDKRARGLGEIGLDYHYDYSPRETQQKVYRRQLELAHELNLPVALHLREAHDDGLRILKEVGPPPAGVLLHCFNLDYAALEPFLALGCHVAFGGPLTFKKSDEVRDAARRTPLNRILTETDAPFMAPHPVRGVVCGPEHVIFTAACLADVFGVSGPEISGLKDSKGTAEAVETAKTAGIAELTKAGAGVGATVANLAEAEVGVARPAEAGDGATKEPNETQAALVFYDRLFQNTLNFFETSH